VPTAAWHCGDSSVTNDPFGAPGSTPSYVCLAPPMGLCWWWLFSSPVLVGQIWTTKNLMKKISKALGEFRFRRFDKHFFWGGGGASDYDEITLCKILYFVISRGLLAEQSSGDAQQIRKWSRCMGRLLRPPHSCWYWYWLGVLYVLLRSANRGSTNTRHLWNPTS
jgi:hypothetical protein